MKFCGNCNQEYDDNLNFCSKCGNALQIKPQEYFCPTCGKSLGESFDRFCPYCGCQFGGKTNNTVDHTHQRDCHITSEYNTDSKRQEINNKRGSFSLGYIFSKECMFSPDGRRGRMGYWGMCLLMSAIMYGVTAISFAAFNPGVAAIMYAVLGLLFIYPMYCNIAKRMHDLNKPTSWAVLFMVLSMVAGYFPKMSFLLILGLYPAFFKGTDGPNQFGDDPTKF